MHQQYYVANGWHSVVRMLFAAVRRAPRRLRVIAILVLALAIGSAGQTPLAQAAPAGTTGSEILMLATKVGGERTICIRDKVIIDVSVWQQFEVVEDVIFFRPLLGIEVEASVVDSSIGTISPVKNSTKLGNDRLETAYFTFSAKKPGTTNIQFWGKINKRVFLGWVLSSDEVYTDIDVTVEDCKYKVSTSSRWVHQVALHTVVAWIERAGMTEDAQGHYTGSASVEWVVTQPKEPILPCTWNTSIPPPSSAQLEGELDGPHLILDVVFETLIFTTSITCPEVGDPTGPYPVRVLPDPLTIRVPSSGGATGRDHALTGSGIIGRSTIVVERVTDR